jgi:hypothetical protein
MIRVLERAAGPCESLAACAAGERRALLRTIWVQAPKRGRNAATNPDVLGHGAWARHSRPT